MTSSLKSKPRQRLLSVAHSPDPDDAFMFYGISQAGLAGEGFRIKHVLKDIQSLNRDAFKGKWHITAISTAAYPKAADKYWILSVGASVGRKYGPMVVSLPGKADLLKRKDWSGLRIATPGPHTTALMLLRLFRPGFTAVDTPFDKIISAVKSRKVDAGLIIHEGQLTYKSHGLVLAQDLGKWWFKDTGLPIPLGLDVVRKDMGRPTARAMARLLVDSIKTAYKRKKDAVDYALKFGRGIDARIGAKFVQMYVNKDTLDMGKEGERALRTLFSRARARGLIDAPVPLDIIRP
jgi:1,4-dihydroxy-6-naphthoate synthase